jgi:hypothetical protein
MTDMNMTDTNMTDTNMTKDMTLTCTLVPESLRTSITADLFGAYFPLQLEPFVFSMASRLSEDYSGGYWNFYQLGNGGFYMAPEGMSSDGVAPDSAGSFQVTSLNGHEGMMSADALGITACLFAYSHMSFGEGVFAETCAEQYHLLREFVFSHSEAGEIFRAID